MYNKKNIYHATIPLINDKLIVQWRRSIDRSAVVLNHCGRNTHIRQIHFAVPNFNFKNIYIQNLNNYVTTSVIF